MTVNDKLEDWWGLFYQSGKNLDEEIESTKKTIANEKEYVNKCATEDESSAHVINIGRLSIYLDELEAKKESINKAVLFDDFMITRNENLYNAALEFCNTLSIDDMDRDNEILNDVISATLGILSVNGIANCYPYYVNDEPCYTTGKCNCNPDYCKFNNAFKVASIMGKPGGTK